MNNCAIKENSSLSAKLQSLCSYTVFQVYHKSISNVLIKFINISPQIAHEKQQPKDLVPGAFIRGIIIHYYEDLFSAVHDILNKILVINLSLVVLEALN